MGEMDIPEQQQIDFPDGLPGLPDRKRYAVLFREETLPYYYLQSLEDPDLCFLTVDPFVFFPDYDFELPDPVVEQLHIESPADIWVRNIVVVREDFARSTVNLQAPLIMNHRMRVGRQVILNHPDYAIRHPLFPHVKKESRSG